MHLLVLVLIKAFKRYKQNYALASLFWTIWYTNFGRFIIIFIEMASIPL